MTVVAIDEKSPHLRTVRDLWRVNSATLGFFPDGAFEYYAQHQRIIVALDPQAHCIGYLLCRMSKKRMTITIVHLCVDSSLRGRGTARELINYLRGGTSEYRGIGLWCRRDFAASQVWPRLGFVPLQEKPGQNQSGELLTYWWLDYGHRTLFSFAEEQIAQSKLRVVIDACVFYDLQDEGTPSSEESKSLLAPWLQDEIALHVTAEIFNEINRHANSKERQRRRVFAQSFPQLTASESQFKAACERIYPFFAQPMIPSDESDVRQLARAIAAGAQFFVTRDNDLLDMSDQIYGEFGVSLIRPCDLIIQFDELARVPEYQPARLAGSRVQLQLAKPRQTTQLVATFRASKEAPARFRQQLHGFQANPSGYAVRVVGDGPQQLLALIVSERSPGKALRIPLLRTAQGPLAATVARHLALWTTLLSIGEGRSLVKVTDPYLSDDTQQALQECGFLRVTDGWVKIVLTAIGKAHDLALILATLGDELPQERGHIRKVANLVHKAASSHDVETMFNLERLLWPAKIENADIPTFIVPIRPEWAMHLFDEQMANQTLFGAEPSLALNRENVYYRARRPGVLSAPARVLWYVTQDRRYQGAGQVRACSQIEAVDVGKPKDLFRKYRRLGVYGWLDVFEVAKKNTETLIMALRFGNTELLHNPIPWATLQQILEKEDHHRSQLQSPLRISKGCFLRLYRLGTQAATNGGSNDS